ncbi:MAG: hypothetical protein FP816_06270 [Desulfobacteraceae bacterium]|nr:hypothetical protein [Desulfobacteraceae bacterium]MBU4055557.1 hypothetical protein [Pseudomonadota bacterium]
MEKKHFVLFLVAAITWAFVMPMSRVQAETATDACSLFTRGNAEILFKETVSEGISRDTTAPAGHSCRYSFNKKGGAYGIKVRVSTHTALQAEGIYASAAEIMERQKNARKASSYASKSFKEVPGHGDDAFWNGTDLWLIKGETLIIITVNAFLDIAAKDMATLEKAKEEKNYSLSLQAAETILSAIQETP